MTTAFPLLPPHADSLNGADLIFAIHGRATERKQRGHDVVDATVGALLDEEGQLAVMPSVLSALESSDLKRACGYAPIAGTPDYLNAIHEHLFHGSELSRQVTSVATPGGTGALHHAFLTTIGRGQAVLTCADFWGPYRAIATTTERRIETFPTFTDEGRFDVAALRERVVELARDEGRVLVLLNTPCHNPTGYSLDAEEWSAVTEALVAASQHGHVSLCLDLAYHEFSSTDSRSWIPAVERLVEHVPVYVAWSASKAFAMYGQRTGALLALVADDDWRARVWAAMSHACRGTWSNGNHLGMLAITRLLGSPPSAAQWGREVGELRDLLARRARAFADEAARLGVRHPRVDSGFFVTVPVDDPEAVAAACEADDVFVVPMTRGVRVALCSTPTAAVPRLVQALARALEVSTASAG